MSRKTVLILFFAWVCSFALEIANGGKSDYVIVTKDNAPKNTVYCAKHIQKYMKVVAGIEMPVTTAKPAGGSERSSDANSERRVSATCGRRTASRIFRRTGWLRVSVCWNHWMRPTKKTFRKANCWTLWNRNCSESERNHTRWVRMIST